ncbi:Metallo-dependent phosphatase-like protein [Limtongia smithiae]|uniref:Metallo-dependent phosphatase-like protein n=1 Tax=Limtongia smithiae TaxID=1125753 RepID=UPI0034D01E59
MVKLLYLFAAVTCAGVATAAATSSSTSSAAATATPWPANGLAPSRDDLISQGVAQVKSIISSTYFDDDCSKCVAALEIAKFMSLTVPDVVPDILIQLCTDEDYSASSGCQVTYSAETQTETTYGSYAADALKLIDPAGFDGQYICYWFFSEACPLPETPSYNLTSWFGEKPKNLTVPEPSGETINVVHLSDLHIQPSYSVGSESNCSQSMCCTTHNYNSDSPNATLEPATRWGAYDCDVPPLMIENTLANVQDLNAEKKFSFAIFTGDMVDHDLYEYLTLANSMEAEADIYYSLKNHLGNVPVYATFGNHDTYPYALYAQNASGVASDFAWNTNLAADLWSAFGWIGDAAEADVRTHYGAFAVTTPDGLRVISFNSNFYYVKNYFNYWNMTNPDTSGMFRFISDELLACEKKGQRAWLMAHIPAGGDTDNTITTGSNVFGQIVERFSPHTIAAIFFGHTHEDQFTIFYSGNGTEYTKENALQIAYVGASITPLTGYNPGWRYYVVDKKTFSVMDTVNYYADLSTLIDSPSKTPDWRFSYSGRSYVPDWPSNAPLNATYWHLAAETFYKNETARNTYLANEYRHSASTPSCDDTTCIDSMYCFFRSGTVDTYIKCLETVDIAVGDDVYFKRKHKH